MKWSADIRMISAHLLGRTERGVSFLGQHALDANINRAVLHIQFPPHLYTCMTRKSIILPKYKFISIGPHPLHTQGGRGETANGTRGGGWRSADDTPMTLLRYCSLRLTGWHRLDSKGKAAAQTEESRRKNNVREGYPKGGGSC